MPSMNLSLPGPMLDWVQGKIDGGEYATADDYLLDLIRRDQARSGQQQVLIEALIEGEQSGISTRTVPDILAAVRKEANSPA